MNLEGFGAQLAAGAWVTVQLGVAAMAVALVLGLFGSLAKESAVPPLRWLGYAYTTVVRGLPELLVILLVYFGSARLLTDLVGLFGVDHYVELSAFAAGTAALAFNYGAYMTEVFRGALHTIPHGHVEAGMALGLPRGRIFRRIVLPQLWRVALPATGNIFLALLKDTALVSVIGVEDLMRKTSLAVGYTKQPFTFYFTAALIYLVLTGLSTAGIYLLERRTTHGMRTLAE
ncbi:MAG TPA: ABC transporter permease subunit [Gammaproteobacteria bacterium]|nr:ABC transporter permease subunit [Gammaproteobacteria bacterium]